MLHNIRIRFKEYSQLSGGCACGFRKLRTDTGGRRSASRRAVSQGRRGRKSETTVVASPAAKPKNISELHRTQDGVSAAMQRANPVEPFDDRGQQ